MKVTWMWSYFLSKYLIVQSSLSFLGNDVRWQKAYVMRSSEGNDVGM